ncbi:MAG: type II toxin-antitoxin system RelE/ParE family toxin [Microcystaceae cyanobacterium]
MPPTKLIFYQDEQQRVPILEWLDQLPNKVQTKCFVKLERLAQLGYELRRPETDFLRDKIYELIINFRGTKYCILYFFYQNQAIIISCCLFKARKVPPAEIEKAIRHTIQFEHNPELHTYRI